MMPIYIEDIFFPNEERERELDMPTGILVFTHPHTYWTPHIKWPENIERLVDMRTDNVFYDPDLIITTNNTRLLEPSITLSSMGAYTPRGLFALTQIMFELADEREARMGRMAAWNAHVIWAPIKYNTKYVMVRKFPGWNPQYEEFLSEAVSTLRICRRWTIPKPIVYIILWELFLLFFPAVYNGRTKKRRGSVRCQQQRFLAAPEYHHQSSDHIPRWPICL